MLAVEFVLELVPGLLEGAVLAADPVVLLEPDIALFNFTAPLESLQWVAADTPDGLVAEGLVAGGGELVCAPAAKMPDARNNAAPNSLYDIAFLLGSVATPAGTGLKQLIARPTDNPCGRIGLQREIKNIRDARERAGRVADVRPITPSCPGLSRASMTQLSVHNGNDHARCNSSWMRGS